jgi:acetate kinase
VGRGRSAVYEGVQMYILVINSGSSSIKFSVFESASGNGSSDSECHLDGELSGIGEPKTKLRIKQPNGKREEPSSFDLKIEDAVQAMRTIFEALESRKMPAIDAVGYRVVHPGAKLNSHQRITPEVLDELKRASEFAPLHDPVTIKVIREGVARFPDVAHYACFDTVFHTTMPEAAYTYAIPAAFRDQGVRRYGFHGLSCESIVRSMRAGGARLPRRMVIAHLGSGCSVTALLDGCSVDNTMGLTPTGGVVMGTRPGDLDPGVLLYLLRQEQRDGDPIGAIESMVNHSSGMVALSGLPNDMRAIRKTAADGDLRAMLALNVFTRSVTMAIGGFCWLMGGLDAIVFAGGIGENDAHTRSAVLADVESLGVDLDHELNEAKGETLRRISSAESKVAIFVVPTQEDLMIAVHVSRMAQSAS